MRIHRPALRLVCAGVLLALAFAARPGSADPEVMPDCEHQCAPLWDTCLLANPGRWDYCRGVVHGCIRYCELF